MAKSLSKQRSKEIGKSGTNIFDGFITGEEYNQDLVGRRAYEIYDEMRRSNATVRAVLSAIKLPVISAVWGVQAASSDPKDEEVAKFVEYNLTKILKWRAFLSEALTHLDFGFAVFECVWGVQEVDGIPRVVVKKLAFRKQTTISKWVQEDGKPGVTQWTHQGERFSIPADQLLVITNQQEGDNYEGVSVLRSAYQHWYIMKNLYKIDAIGHERQALGVVRIQHPSNADGKDIERAEEAARNLRANEEAFIRQPEGWAIEFMDMKAGTLKDIEPSLNHHDRQISKNVLAQWLEIGAQGSSGTLAASGDQSRLFDLANKAVADNIAAEVTEQVVKQLVDSNFNVTEYPTVVAEQVGKEDLTTLSSVVKTLIDAKVLTPSDADEAYLRKLIRLPKAEEGEERRVVDGTPAPAQADGEQEADEDQEIGDAPADDVKANRAMRARFLSASRTMKRLLEKSLYGPTDKD
ncbi:phage portal protein family protein [Tsukamurella spumae]|uniref:DUF935 family protein n=1 Tax=Tsukamurella spumae TaxID=44753 RepID=A0A846X3V0_9ACTN|nr:DUF935 family protein [Tsukamurella spumae]NKY18872.1 DUF935 family protein [Tsukamurella spumae]